jgi:hypothetical protein
MKPTSVHDMAYRRGLSIAKAKHGGWYVTIIGAPWGSVLYASHSWVYIKKFIRSRPILVKRKDV